MSIRIVRHGLYLNRTGRQVGIVGPARMAAASPWKWLTTRGHYVTENGRAALSGESVEDLVRDVTPTDAEVAGADSMLGGLK